MSEKVDRLVEILGSEGDQIGATLAAGLVNRRPALTLDAGDAVELGEATLALLVRGLLWSGLPDAQVVMAVRGIAKGAEARLTELFRANESSVG